MSDDEGMAMEDDAKILENALPCPSAPTRVHPSTGRMAHVQVEAVFQLRHGTAAQQMRLLE